jgi:hypothetical protein
MRHACSIHRLEPKGIGLLHPSRMTTLGARVDRNNDIVAAVRWIEGSAMDGFVKRLIAAASKS